jgi:dinuclear metal center YbgI/SA1388 family protein
MTVRDIQEIIEEWAPAEIAWERDNVGLQVGDPAARITGIIVALDATLETILEARRKKANLLISHHPLLFRPINSITPTTDTGRCIEALARHRINLYSIHTNLDFTRDGTSFALAAALNLRDVEFLRRSYQVQDKIVTFVPANHVEQVTDAMARAGAGRERGKLEYAPEVRLEMVATKWHAKDIVQAMKQAHPYEEAAYDLYTTENVSDDYGMGVVGSLARAVELKSFLASVKRALGSRSLRCTGNLSRKVRRIAVCGGSGSDLVDEAIKQGADVFVTADVKYHAFHHAAGKIALVDAGHYETEYPVIHSVVAKLKRELNKMTRQIPVYATEKITNPILYV